MNPQLEIDGIFKSFGGVSALCGLSFSVSAGRVLGIVGGNGAGKTTAIDVITGRYSPDKGDIRFSGQSIRGKSTEALGRKGICRSSQSPELPSALTVTEYLSLGHNFGRFDRVVPNLIRPGVAKQHRKDARRAALEALDRFGLLGLANRNCRQLSGGERKFVSILRVFLRQPKVLFLDEPTTALSETLVRFVEELCREFVATGGALAIISHSTAFIQELADDIVLIEEGRAANVTEKPQTRWHSIAPDKKRHSVSTSEPVISTHQLVVCPNGVPLLSDVTFSVCSGALTGVIGPNGVGKSTLLKTIQGLLPRPGGSIEFAGVDITQRPSHEIAALGLGLSLQGARIPPRLTVASALKMAANPRVSRNAKLTQLVRAIWDGTNMFADALERFPSLSRRANVRAGLLSGGEQQLLAIAMQLCRRPIALLLDEPSVGLHDTSLHQAFTWVRELASRGLAGIVVEQNTDALYSLVDSTLQIRNGQLITLDG